MTTPRTCPRCGTDFRVKYPSDKKVHCSYSCASKSHSHRPGKANSNWRGGKTKHPLYLIYMDMIARCHRPTHLRYFGYGGRGIAVCQRWRDDFWAFVSDMGERPKGVLPSGRAAWSLDRIDNNGNYEPGNCRWATTSQQMKNRRTELAYAGLERDPSSGQWRAKR